MPSKFNLPPELDISLNEDFTKDRLDTAWNYLIQRLLILDSFKPQYQEQIDTLRSIGLERLNEALQPVYQQIVSIANLGAIFEAHSSSEATIGTGLKSFEIPEETRAKFAPTAYMAAATGDGFDIVMRGQLSSYDRTTGTLVLNIDHTIGAGTYTEWTLAPSASDEVARTYVDQKVASARADLLANDATNATRALDTAVAMSIALG